MGRRIVYIIVMLAVVAFLYYLEKKAPENVIELPIQVDTTSPVVGEFGPAYLPTANGQLLIYDLHALSYREDHEQAEWVAYTLRPEHLTKEPMDRPYFVPDKRVSTGTAHHRDYKNSPYNKGHLLPAADRKLSIEDYQDTFLMSNVSPQDPGFNAGIWNSLEQKVRYWSKKYDGVYVVTGGVLEEGLPTIGRAEVSVPAYFYKIVINTSQDRPRASAFLIPNKETTNSFYEYRVTIDQIEARTGIDFFAGLDQEMESQLESGRWKELVD